MTNVIQNFLKKHIFLYFPTSLAYHAEKIKIGLKQLSLASLEVKKDVSDCKNNILLDNKQSQIDIDTLNQIAVKVTKCGFLSPLTSITS